MNLDKIKNKFRQDFWGKLASGIVFVLGKVWNFGKRFFRTLRVLNPTEQRVVIILAIIVIVSTILLFRNYYLRNATEIPQVGGAYIEGVIGTPKYLNPILAKTEIDRDISRLIFASLLRFNKSGTVASYLAKEYKISKDGKIYSFILDKRYLWHDGEEITPEDVEFTINVLKNEGYVGPYEDAFDGVSFKKTGNKKFDLILSDPSSNFIYSLASIGILPRHKLGEVEVRLLDKSEFNLNPIGSGSYEFDAEKSQINGIFEIALKRAQNYQGDNPGYIEEITFRSYETKFDLIDAYKKGEISGFGGLASYNGDKTDLSSFLTYKIQLPRFVAIFINLENPKLSKLKLRQALSHALNKKRIKDEVFDEEAEILHSPIPSFVFGHKKDVEKFGYHPPTTGTYLDELGFVDSDMDGVREKDGEKLSFRILTTDDPCMQETANIVADEWNKEGIEVFTEITDLSTLQSDIAPVGDFDLLLVGGNIGLTPGLYSYFHSSEIGEGFNFSGYKSDKADKFLETARLSSDTGTRLVNLSSLQDQLAKDLPAIFLYSAPYLYGSNKAIKGIPESIIAGTSTDRFLFVNEWYIKSERTR